MKNKTVQYSGKNSIKLFMGIFVSVVSIFALVNLVQNPLVERQPEAATTYSYTLNVKPSVKTSNCNSKISYYIVSSKFVSATNTGYVIGTTTNKVVRKSPTAFSAKIGKVYNGKVIVIQTAYAYTGANAYIGSQNLGASVGISPNGSASRSIAIACNIY